MEPLRQVEGRAIPFGRKNIDTDVIIPAHWLKTISREGLGVGAFEAVHAAMVDAMTRLERAFKPHVQKLSIESA